MIILSAFEMDGQLRQRQAAVLHWMRPALRDCKHTGVKSLEQAVLVGEGAFGLGKFSTLAVAGNCTEYHYIIAGLQTGAVMLPTEHSLCH